MVNSFFDAAFLEIADKAAREYVDRFGKKTYLGLKRYISNNLSKFPISPENKKDIVDVTAEEYRSKLKAI